MKKFLHIVLWAALLAGVIAAMAFAEKQHRQALCTGFDLLIENPSQDMLMQAGEIKSKILEITDTFAGRAIVDVDLHRISNILKANPFIADADVLADISGKVRVEVMLRRPVMRLENLQGNDYYIDEDGWLIPVNPGHPVRVVIASGYLRDKIPVSADGKVQVSSLAKGSILPALYRMAMIIDHSDFLKKLIAQVWVGNNEDIVLSPVIGDYKIRFGKPADLQEKFDKLETFLREGAGNTGWIDYRSVDLRYDNQIICSKK